MMKCSVIIRAYNEERHIGRLIDGIKCQEFPVEVDLEIIVVDSGSTDSTVSIARHMGARVISISKADFSFGKALNIGCESASGDILLIASAHVYPVYTDWMVRMTTPFADEKVGLVYGRQVGSESTHFSEHQVFQKWFPLESNYNQRTPFCNNANCAIRKSLWKLQRYDEMLTGLEDIDWAQKIMNMGYKVIYDADAVIVHVHEETPQKIRNRYQREAIALKQIMPKVHVSLADFIRLFLTNVLSDSVLAARKGVLWKESGNIIMFRFMQFYGTYIGHQLKGTISMELKNRFYYPNGIKKVAFEEAVESLERRKIDYS